MRLIRMSERSVYHGLLCQHCHKRVAVGRAALVSTFYVTPGISWVRTQSSPKLIDKLWEQDEDEIQLRFVYHRSCLEGILMKGPNDPAIEIAEFNAYRAALLERIGGTCPTPPPEYEPFRARQDL